MEKPNEVKMLKWKGEVTFEGTPDQFKSFTEALQAHAVTVSIAEHKLHPGVIAGYMRRLEVGSIITKGLIDRVSEGAVTVPMPATISGGMRSPHIHVGQEVRLVSKEQFKTFLGEVARQIAENRVETESDFYNMIQPLVKQDL